MQIIWSIQSSSTMSKLVIAWLMTHVREKNDLKGQKQRRFLIWRLQYPFYCKHIGNVYWIWKYMQIITKAIAVWPLNVQLVLERVSKKKKLYSPRTTYVHFYLSFINAFGIIFLYCYRFFSQKTTIDVVAPTLCTLNHFDDVRQ